MQGKGERVAGRVAGRLVLSAGMPRAGSGWHYNLIHDLVVASGGQDARRVRARYHLGRFLTEVNCNIGHLRPHRLLPVLFPVLMGNTFAVKTHAGPTGTALGLIQRGWIRAAYIYRDPRAALLSAFEYGQCGLQAGRANAFSYLTDLSKAGDFMRKYVEISEEWLACDSALIVRYEDLLSNYEAEIERLALFLGVDPTSAEARCVVDKYRPERGDSAQKGTHFSQGQAERFRKVFTADQLAAFNEQFGAYLERLGYS